MKNYLVWLCVSVLFAATACDKKEKQPVAPVPVDYQSWKKPLPKSLDYPIPGHGDSRRIVYINKKGLEATFVKDRNNRTAVDFPDGSILIKEVFKREGVGYGTIPQLVVMVKDRHNQEAQDGWLYYVRNPGSPQVTLIKSQFCVGCHDAANEVHPYFDNNLEGMYRDYVFLNVAR